MLLAARDEGVRSVVFASSSSVYGNVGELPRRENQHTDPMSPYGVSKLAAERYCVAFSASMRSRLSRSATSTSSARTRTRARQYAAVVPRFIASVRDGRPVPIHGDGTQSRDFTYVSNVVDANLLAAAADGVSGAVLNVATGRQLSVNELADAIGKALGLSVEREYLPQRAGVWGA